MNGADLIIERRLAETERVQDMHRLAGRGIEAAACEIRIQAFREALAIIRGRALPAMRMHQRMGTRSAERRS